jgi:DNA-binding MarR family transcriptional regulator
MPPTATPRSPKSDSDRLRGLVQRFVRSFGLLVTKETPCGQPLSPSYAHALMVLLERAREQAPTSQAALGVTLGIDKSNVTRLCSRMEAAGHVSQERASDDGRSRLVSLTGSGKRLAQRIEQASQARFSRIVVALPRRERSTVFASLAALNAAIESLGEGEERA